ncbi:hypothetical protein PUN28_006223 [Cardiocondyla obscurior]|uniref:Uncharacterized protein n=1 Tax=Cardiocondyla obscurior TaxID=286306 RepID=A0AAW2G877_9HYME
MRPTINGSTSTFCSSRWLPFAEIKRKPRVVRGDWGIECRTKGKGGGPSCSSPAGIFRYRTGPITKSYQLRYHRGELSILKYKCTFLWTYQKYHFGPDIRASRLAILSRLCI